MWLDGNWKVSEENPPHMTIQDDDGHAKNIKYKQPSEATKVVGVWQDLTGISAKMMSELTIRTRQVHSVMTESLLPKCLMWIGLRQAM